MVILYVTLLPPADQVRNSYQLCNNGTLRVMYANGMGISYHTEPHILAGSVSPTIGRRNISLPTDNGLNSIEWRLRKELAKGKVTVFGRKLRVGTCSKILITVIMYIIFAFLYTLQAELCKIPA